MISMRLRIHITIKDNHGIKIQTRLRTHKTTKMDMTITIKNMIRITRRDNEPDGDNYTDGNKDRDP